MEASQGEGLSFVRPEGRVDSATSAEFEASMSQVVENGRSNLLVDLGQVTFMASAGLRVLLSVAKKMAREKRALRVFGLNGLVRETFEVSGFVSIIDVRESEEDAREGLA